MMLDNAHYHLKKRGIYLLLQNLKFEPILTEENCFDHVLFDFISFPIIKMDRLVKINPGKRRIFKKAGDIFFDLMEEFLDGEGAESNEYSQLVEGYLKYYLFFVDKHYDIGMINDTCVRSMLEYILEHTSDIMLKDLMRVVNLERNYMIRIFKQCMDVILYKYIKSTA